MLSTMDVFRDHGLHQKGTCHRQDIELSIPAFRDRNKGSRLSAPDPNHFPNRHQTVVHHSRVHLLLVNAT